MVRNELRVRNIEIITGWLTAHARAGHRVRFECRDRPSSTELVFLLSDPEAFLQLVSGRPEEAPDDSTEYTSPVV